MKKIRHKRKDSNLGREHKGRDAYGNTSDGRGGSRPIHRPKTVTNRGVHCGDHPEAPEDFYHHTCGVMITQVHWNPSTAASDGNYYDDDDWEYVEITNTTDEPKYMTSVTLTSQSYESNNEYVRMQWYCDGYNLSGGCEESHDCNLCWSTLYNTQSYAYWPSFHSSGWRMEPGEKWVIAKNYASYHNHPNYNYPGVYVGSNLFEWGPWNTTNTIRNDTSTFIRLYYGNPNTWSTNNYKLLDEVYICPDYGGECEFESPGAPTEGGGAAKLHRDSYVYGSKHVSTDGGWSTTDEVNGTPGQHDSCCGLDIDACIFSSMCSWYENGGGAWMDPECCGKFGQEPNECNCSPGKYCYDVGGPNGNIACDTNNLNPGSGIDACCCGMGIC